MKSSVKRLVQWLSVVVMLPVSLMYLLLRLVLNEHVLFQSLCEALSLLPGKTGSFLRVGFMRVAMQGCHSDVRIGFGVLFSHADTEIGEGAYLGPNCNIGRSAIGNNCLLGSNVHILSGSGQHNFDDLTIPVKEQGGTFKKVKIGKDSWIGNNAVILDDVGEHCVIGAGSVVTKPLPDFAIAVGNPAKIIGSRDKHGEYSEKG